MKKKLFATIFIVFAFSLVESIQAFAYDTVQSTKTVRWNAWVDQRHRWDGVYSSGPFYTSAATSSSNQDGKNYNGHKGYVTYEKTTNRSTYVQFYDETAGKSYWIDKGALTARFTTIPIAIPKNDHNNSYVAINQWRIGRSDGTYTNGAFRTTFETIDYNNNARNMQGSIGKITSAVQVNNEFGSNAYIAYQVSINGVKYWIDRDGLQGWQSNGLMDDGDPVSNITSINPQGRIIWNYVGSDRIYYNDFKNAANYWNSLLRYWLGYDIFVEQSSANSITGTSPTLYVYTDQKTTWAYGGYGGGYLGLAKKVISQDRSDRAYTTSIHELGHAMGINHTGANIDGTWQRWGWAPTDIDLMISGRNESQTSNWTITTETQRAIDTLVKEGFRNTIYPNYNTAINKSNDR